MKELRLEDMTVEQKLGMVMLFRRAEEEEDIQFTLEMIKKKAVGGVQVFYQKGKSEETVRKYKEAATYPLLFCGDLLLGAPGSENRIAAGGIDLSSTGDVNLAYEFAKMAAIEIKKAGYNTVWAPVVDIGGGFVHRFSDDPKKVAEFATAMVKAYQEQGVICTEKHFPSPIAKRTVGSRHVDGHIEVKKPRPETFDDLMESGALYPYLHAIENADLSGIMVGHNEYENIEPGVPASLSPRMIKLIREKLGFKGLLMSDSMAMMGVAKRFRYDESIWMSIAAGVDIVLPNHKYTNRECYEALLKAYNEGKIPDERLDDAVTHVLEAQRKVMKEPTQTGLTERQKQLCDEISRKSLVAITKNGAEVTLSENTKKLFVIEHENWYPADEAIGTQEHELPDAEGYNIAAANEKRALILKEFPDAEVLLISEWPHQSETQQLCKMISEFDETIFFGFAKRACYLASDTFSVRLEYVIESYADKISTLVYSGNPHEMAKFNYIDKRIFALPAENTTQLVLDALKGRFVPGGKLPYNID